MSQVDAPATKPPPILDPVRNRIQVKHYSLRAVTQYIEWVRRFMFRNARGAH